MKFKSTCFFAGILFFLLSSFSLVYAADDKSDNSVVIAKAADVASPNGSNDKGSRDNAGNGSINVSDPQKPIVVKRNKPIFSIILQANRTTGFSWALKNYDAVLIRPISSTYFAEKKTLMGVGGYEKWTFAAKPQAFVVPQTTSITLIYARPWDLQGAQAANFKVVTTHDS